jgi:drug/metabolite transporter (DMT)-like permease
MQEMTALRYLTLAAIWGSSFTFIKVALEGLTPSQLVLARLAIGALFLAGVACARRVGLPRGRGTWGAITAAAIFGTVAPFLLLSYGERGASAGTAGILIGTTPLITLGLAAILLPDEKVDATRLAGLVLGFAGVVVVVASTTNSSAGTIGGDLACLGAAASYAAGFVIARRYLTPRGLPPLSLAAGQLTASTLLLLVFMPVFPWVTPHATGHALPATLALGLAGTGVAYVIYFRLIGDIGATNASTVNYLVPIFAVLIGGLALGETVPAGTILGGAIVVTGIAIAERRLRIRPAATQDRPSLPEV